MAALILAQIAIDRQREIRELPAWLIWVGLALILLGMLLRPVVRLLFGALTEKTPRQFLYGSQLGLIRNAAVHQQLRELMGKRVLSAGIDRDLVVFLLEDGYQVAISATGSDVVVTKKAGDYQPPQPA